MAYKYVKCKYTHIFLYMCTNIYYPPNMSVSPSCPLIYYIAAAEFNILPYILWSSMVINMLHVKMTTKGFVTNPIIFIFRRQDLRLPFQQLDNKYSLKRETRHLKEFMKNLRSSRWKMREDNAGRKSPESFLVLCVLFLYFLVSTASGWVA